MGSIYGKPQALNYTPRRTRGMELEKSTNKLDVFIFVKIN